MNRYRTLILIIIIDLLLVGGAWGLSALRQDKALSVATAHAQYAALREHGDQGYVLTRQLEATKKEQESLLRQFVTRETMIGFLEDVDRWGVAAGVEVKILNISETEPIKLELRALGSYRATTHFLTLLEQMPYLATVSDVRFGYSGADQVTTPWALTVSLELLTLEQ